jgi:hypothetical protein
LARVVAQPAQLLGVLQQGQDGIAELVHRGNVAGGQQHALRTDLLGRQPAFRLSLQERYFLGLLEERQRREEGAHQFRVQALAPAAFDDAVQQFALTFGVRDGLAGIPVLPRDLVHQRQPLLHEAQYPVEGCQVGPRCNEPRPPVRQDRGPARPARGSHWP